MMKKVVMWMIVLVCLGFSASAATVFNDNFNRANNATVGNGWNEIESSAAWTILSNAAHLQASGTGINGQINHTYVASSAETINFSFTLTAGLFGFKTKNDSRNYIDFGASSSQLSYNNGSSTINFRAGGLGNSYDISFRNINYSSFTFDIWVNGTLNVTGALMNTKDGNMSEFVVFSTASGDTTTTLDVNDVWVLSSGDGSGVDSFSVVVTDFNGNGTINDFDVLLSRDGSFQSNASSLVFSGSWQSGNPAPLAFDGNYGTYAEGTHPTASYIYFNYSVPSNANNGTVWEVYASSLNNNYTLPGVCEYDNVIQLLGMIDASVLYFKCYNGTAWQVLDTIAGNIKLYEEGVYWNLDEDDEDYLFLYEVSNGSVTIGSQTISDNEFWNITVSSNGYISQEFLNYDTGSDLDVVLSKYIFYNGSSGNVTLEAFVWHEDYPTVALLSDVEVNVVSWWGREEDFVNVSFSWDDVSAFNLSIFANVTVYADVYVKYTVGGGFTHRYYLYNQSFNNTGALEIDLYNFNSTSGLSDLKLTVRHRDDYTYFSQVVGKLQRFYVGEGLWRTVQHDESGDFGSLFFNIYEENTDYRLLFVDRDNNVLRTTDSMKFLCVSSVCDLTFLLDESVGVGEGDDVEFVVNYDNGTSVFTVIWSEVSGESADVEFVVSKNMPDGTQILYEESQSGAGGIITYNASGVNGDAFVEFNVNDVPESSFWQRLARPTLSTFVDAGEAAMWTFLFAITAGGMGVASPVIGIVGIFFVLVAMFYFGILAPLTVTFVVIVGVVGLVIGIRRGKSK